MLRRTFLLIPSPGRADEAAAALQAWLKEVEHLPGFNGGAVLREYAREFAHLPDVLTLTYDLERDTRHEFWEAAKALPDPIRPDLGDEIPPDQTAILLAGGAHEHAPGEEHDHAHHAGNGAHDAADQLDFNRGGGLFARVLHLHSEILVDTTRYPSATPATSGRAS